MKLRYDDETEAFRDELVAWMEANAPTPDEMAAEERRSSADLTGWARRWQRQLFDAGWLMPGWPPELGGCNATQQQQMVYFEEFARRDLPRSVNPQGLGIVAPSLVDAGTEEQKEQFLLPTLRGEVSWAVGMSEPDAGSDLANLKTRAVRDGDRFIVNGQKVWTSGAHHADWCFCFVRTDPDAAKHKGISLLIIDMNSPGITCRPLPDLTDPNHADFNEVFFEDVDVPAERLVGDLDRGWGLAMGSLGHERSMLWLMQANTLERNVRALRQLGTETGPDGRRYDEDPAFREALGAAYLDTQAVWFLGYQGFAKAMAGQTAPEHMLLKLYSSEVAQSLFRAGLDLTGAHAVDITGDPGGTGPTEGPWAMQYLRSFANTIAGGASEIQRNIIAERVLGLPRA